MQFEESPIKAREPIKFMTKKIILLYLQEVINYDDMRNERTSKFVPRPPTLAPISTSLSFFLYSAGLVVNWKGFWMGNFRFCVHFITLKQLKFFVGKL